MKRDDVLNIRVPSDLKKAIHRAAEDDHGRSSSGMVVRILREWLVEKGYVEADSSEVMAEKLRLTREQRLIIYQHATRGASKDECDSTLAEHGFPPVHAGSYAGNVKREGRLFQARPELMEVLAARPLPYGDWPDDWKAHVRTRPARRRRD